MTTERAKVKVERLSPKPPTEPSVVQALVAVMDDVGAVRKGDRNTQQNFSFRGIDAVVNAVSPALRKHGVIVVPEVIDSVYGTVEVGHGERRRDIGHVRVTVAYHFHGPAGDSVTATVIGESMDSGDKASPKAMSVAFRTALLQALALPTDEPDPDSHVYERAERQDSPSPLQKAREELANVWRAKHDGGLDTKAVEDAFAQWSGGEIFTDATPARLRSFAAAVAAEEGAETQQTLPKGDDA